MQNLENEHVRDGELSVIEETEAFYEILINRNVITDLSKEKKRHKYLRC